LASQQEKAPNMIRPIATKMTERDLDGDPADDRVHDAAGRQPGPGQEPHARLSAARLPAERAWRLPLLRRAVQVAMVGSFLYRG